MRSLEDIMRALFVWASRNAFVVEVCELAVRGRWGTERAEKEWIVSFEMLFLVPFEDQ